MDNSIFAKAVANNKLNENHGISRDYTFIYYSSSQNQTHKDFIFNHTDCLPL